MASKNRSWKKVLCLLLYVGFVNPSPTPSPVSAPTRVADRYYEPVHPQQQTQGGDLLEFPTEYFWTSIPLYIGLFFCFFVYIRCSWIKNSFKEHNDDPAISYGVLPSDMAILKSQGFFRSNVYKNGEDENDDETASLILNTMSHHNVHDDLDDNNIGVELSHLSVPSSRNENKNPLRYLNTDDDNDIENTNDYSSNKTMKKNKKKIKQDNNYDEIIYDEDYAPTLNFHHYENSDSDSENKNDIIYDHYGGGGGGGSSTMVTEDMGNDAIQRRQQKNNFDEGGGAAEEFKDRDLGRLYSKKESPKEYLI
mmetsp:Transcript_51084/g.65384  ORF Transcript_51084/g.65384 Transcript_51084/m.65384 type:complete len:308 (+) Transcript_51084:81-1004(+)